MIAQIDESFVVGERIRADVGKGENHLDAGPGTILERGEADLSTCAREHDAASNSHPLIGEFCPGLNPLEPLPDGGD